MYGCPNCNNIFEPSVFKTVATEPFIRCPECGMSRALNSEVWDKNAAQPKTKISGDDKLNLEEKEKVVAKKPAKKSTKKSKKK